MIIFTGDYIKNMQIWYKFDIFVLINCKGLIYIFLAFQQDMSLLDSLPVDRNFIRESLDDVNIDVLDEEEIAMQVNDQSLLFGIKV